ncbi:PilC/PilY family type IV pilus protein [Sapientia aquatica]|nr:PilC/PilY family type IV pilus protein [Sapientia aquatica]
MKKYSISVTGAFVMVALTPLFSYAQITVQEDFNTNKLTHPWIAINGACLTASTDYSTKGATVPNGTVPGCVDGSGNANQYYAKLGSTLVGGKTGGKLPDASLSGALRLTNGASSGMSSTNGNNETGAIISGNSFPSNQGLHITFNTLTWGGNAYNNGKQNSGADGINFFLLDASKYSTDSSGIYVVNATGSFGGALGYDCSPGKSPPDGFSGGFLGLGIDEYGNYANKGDNGSAYDPLSPGVLYNAITLRGPGDITGKTFPTSNGQATGVNPGQGPIVSPANVCKYGFYTTSATPTSSTTSVSIAGSPKSSTTTYTPDYKNNVVTEVVYNVGKSSYTTTTNVYPFTLVKDYPILTKPQALAGGNVIFNQEYIATPQRQNAIPISYTVDITSGGLLSISYSYNNGVSTPVITNASILDKVTYPTTGLPDNFLYGFAAGTGGGSNNHEITCFKAAQYTDSSSSAGGNIPQNTQVKDKSGEQIYLASYNPTFWSGSLTATALYVKSDGSVGIGNVDSNGKFTDSSALWDAGCVLTGVVTGQTCVTTKGGPVAAQSSSSRFISTWSGSNTAGAAGTTFSSGNFGNFPSNSQTALNDSTVTPGSSDSLGSARVDYLRGDRSREVTKVFRTRRSVLGDIINSSPVSVGAPSGSYPTTGSWVDLIQPSDSMKEGTSYATFQSKNSSRLNLVLAGANDGMLHAFQAGTWSNGTFSQTNNDGKEAFAYVPSLALNTIHNNYDIGEFDYMGMLYAHNAFVDATPGFGDLYYNNAWHTWAVGGLGAGGNLTGVNDNPAGTAVGAIYALDITNVAVPETDASVNSRVMGDWNSNTITCDNNNSCGQFLGSTYGTPIIKRLHSGNWAIIFGNGLNSAKGTSGIFVGEITGAGPTVTFHYYDTGAGPVIDTAQIDPLTNKVSTIKNPASNGMTYVTGADLDGDHIVDYVYGGDSVGNIWRFDLTSTDPTKWGNSPFNLFNATNSSGNGLQPITTAPIVSAITYNSTQRVMINFGTGRQYPQSLNVAASYAPAGQELYGIWDWNMDAWNKLQSTQYVSLSKSPGTINTSNLTTQTLTDLKSLGINFGTNNVTGASQGYTASSIPICFPDVTGCSGPGTVTPSYGWVLALPNTGEEIIYNPTINNGILFVNSIIPSNIDNLSCTAQPPSGFSYAIDAGTGGASVGVFNPASDIPSSTPVVGVGISGVGTPYFAIAADPKNNTVTTMITQTQQGNPIGFKVNLGSSGTGPAGSNRLTWLEIR